ncbi:hypothetical protein VSS37_10435 [Candidatus Thiothrix sp. Deng01]|uniref:Uncharacterized protein n=1 Tax=Candidatus Thiothrix phosphatis TaxID=3112415 RepID=A0ABU6CXU7_9GAMM|nr:hypothetical protein [Candidatus Thiothrix sp. Deng01]MEB4591396.1 hypothetical protein [Candidatus Thiothrix sp. Deng01]
MSRSQAEGMFWLLAGVSMCLLAAGMALALVIWAAAPQGIYPHLLPGGSNYERRLEMAACPRLPVRNRPGR